MVFNAGAGQVNIVGVQLVAKCVLPVVRMAISAETRGVPHVVKRVGNVAVFHILKLGVPRLNSEEVEN